MNIRTVQLGRLLRQFVEEHSQHFHAKHQKEAEQSTLAAGQGLIINADHRQPLSSLSNLWTEDATSLRAVCTRELWAPRAATTLPFRSALPASARFLRRGRVAPSLIWRAMLLRESRSRRSSARSDCRIRWEFTDGRPPLPGDLIGCPQYELVACGAVWSMARPRGWLGRRHAAGRVRPLPGVERCGGRIIAGTGSRARRI